MKQRLLPFLALAFLPLLPAGIASAQNLQPTAVATEEQALAAIAASRLERVAKAVPVELWAPLPQIQAGDQLNLVLNNAFGLELLAQVDLLDADGQARSLGSFKVPPSRHHRIRLHAVLTSDVFANAQVVRVSYPGDIEMFQAWLVRDGASGAEETLLRSATGSAARELSVFWDSTWLSGGAAKVHVINTYDQHVLLEATFPGSGHKSFELELGPGASRQIPVPPALTSGRLLLRHRSAPGVVLAFGSLDLTQGRLTLPVHGDDAFPEASRYAAVRLPTEGAFFGVALLDPEPQPVTLSLYDPGTGGLLAVAEQEIGPGGIFSFDIERILVEQVGRAPGEFVSARLSSGARRVLVAAGSVSAAGKSVDAPVFAEAMAHQNGSYPILDSSRFRTVATLLNLGDEDSLIGGQVLWENGSYAVGPVRVRAGGAAEIDLGSRTLSEQADRAGRRLPTELPNGYFQWTVLRGSHAILARTEARRSADDDVVGFNCLGCCEEYSFGRIEPDGASLLPGEIKPLEGNEYIASCGATLGPFQPWFALINSPSPFTWDGDRVGAGQPAASWVSFEGEGERVRPPRCESTGIRFGDGAPVQSLRVTIDEVSLPADRIRVTLTPYEAFGTLTVRLRSPAIKDLVYAAPYGGGTYTFNFSPLASFSEGQEFAEVYVEWRASTGTSSPTTATAVRPYRFKVLGDYLHTQYNSPIETSCTGALSPFCFQAGGCGGISCGNATTAQGRSVWISEVLENGSGVHSSLGIMSREYFCGRTCGSYSRFRAVPAPCGSCNTSLVAYQSVARSEFNYSLECGNLVFIEGLGLRTVADTGGDLSTRQLDHFAGASGCNVEQTLGYLKTFKLF